MNRYNEHLYYKAVVNEILMSNDGIPTMQRKKELEDMYKKKKLYKSLRTTLLMIQERKQTKKIKHTKYKYSDEDLDYIRELTCFDLTFEEARLLNRTKEQRTCERYIYSQFHVNKEEKKLLDEEFERLGSNLTLRLMYNKYNEIKRTK